MTTPSTAPAPAAAGPQPTPSPPRASAPGPPPPAIVQPSRAARLTSLSVAVGSAALLLAAGWAAYGFGFVGRSLGLAATIFFVAGKLIVFAGMIDGLPLTRWSPVQLGLIVIYMDTMVGLLVAYNLDLLYRLPWVGKRMLSMRRASALLLGINPWMRRFAFAGVTAVVAFPVTGSGAIGATFLGQLLGLPRRTILAGIVAGATAGSLGLALGAKYLGRALAEVVQNPFLQVGLAAVMVTALVLLCRWFLRSARRLSGSVDAAAERPAPGFDEEGNEVTERSA